MAAWLRLVLILVGAGAFAGRALAPPVHPTPQPKPLPANEYAGKRKDMYGDPLPRGAIARLGSPRLRHTAGVTDLAWSASGQVLASAGSDMTIHLWQADSGRHLRTMDHALPYLIGSYYGVTQIALRGDGEVLAAIAVHEPPPEASAKGQIHVIGGLPPRSYLCVYDASTGKLTYRMTIFGYPQALAFSPGGEYLAVGGSGGVAIRDLFAGVTIRDGFAQAPPPYRSLGQGGLVVCLAFSADGKLLVTGSDDRTVRIWDIGSAKVLHRLQAGDDKAGPASPLADTAVNVPGPVAAVAFSPDGATVAAAGKDAAIRIWDAHSGRLRRTIASTHRRGVKRLAFLPDGGRLASGGCDGLIRLWDLQTGKVLRVLQPPRMRSMIYSLKISPDGKTIASCCQCDNRIRLWDARTGRQRLQLPGHAHEVSHLAWATDGRYIASIAHDDTAILWDVAKSAPTSMVWAVGYQIAVSPDSLILAATRGGGEICFYRVPSLAKFATLRATDGGNPAAAFSPDGKWFACAGNDKVVRVWDVATRAEKARLVHPDALRASVAFSPDGRTLAAISGKAIFLWDAAAGKVRRKLRIPSKPGATDAASAIKTLAFSPAGRILAAAGDEEIALWSSDEGEAVGRLPLPGRTTGSGRGGIQDPLAFSPDGRILATGGRDSAIRGWEMATGRIAFVFRGPRVAGRSLAFSPDGKMLASGHADSSVLIWALNPAQADAPARKKQLQPREMERLWFDLAEKNTKAAHEAIWTFVNAPDAAVGFLSRHLQLDLARWHKGPGQIGEAIRRLDHDKFSVRQEACELLRQFGPVAEPALREALKSAESPEAKVRLRSLLLELATPFPRPANSLRHTRAIGALELIGTQAVRAALQKLAVDRPETPTSKLAAAAIRRLRNRRTGALAGR